MKLLFDLLNSQPAEGSKFHGGGEYIKTVFKKLAENSDDTEITVFYDSDRFLDDWIKEIISKYSIRQLDIKTVQDIQTIKEPFDVFYSGLPYNYKREWIPEIKKFIGTVHGLRGLEKPDDEYDYMYENKPYHLAKAKKQLKKIKYSVPYFKEKRYKGFLNSFRSSIDALDVIICDSLHTKYSIMNHYSTPSERILVRYAPKKVASVLSDSEESLCPKGKYILLVGGNRWIKNIYRAILAIDSLITDGKLKDYKVAVVGNLSASIRHTIKNPESFVLLDYISSGQLEELYKNCRIFVYPSLNEGFGYPPLEAMAYGKTCVVSAVCSLPEVCGDSAYYVNPYDINEIKTRILHAVDCQIPERKVLEHFRAILARQDADLESIVRIIEGSAE